MDAPQLLRPFVVRGSGAEGRRGMGDRELLERRSSTLERPPTARGCPAYPVLSPNPQSRRRHQERSGLSG
jgi:hypothetical protein